MTMCASTRNTVPSFNLMNSTYTLSNEPVHVVAAAIFNDQGQVLITRRADHVHQGGLWEFPGGKLEAGESVQDGLKRELQEEVGITINHILPLIRLRHDYADKSVLLDVWRVEDFSGTAHGAEGQPLNWVRVDELQDYAFPEANHSIISALRLPAKYLITPDPGEDRDGFLQALGQSIDAGASLVQLRAKSLAAEDYEELAQQALAICREKDAQLLLNAEPALVEKIGAHGVQLTGSRLLALKERPLGREYWVCASCHTLHDLEHANSIGADFAMLSPVKATASHPDDEPLGWDRFEEMIAQVPFPVYALGGMSPDMMKEAKAHGAQGVAAIRALWVQQ
jgi:8-oxo-dGTP diphosphatase